MSDYGNRDDGTPKGRGFFGELNRRDGDFSTELTYGVNLDGHDIQIPFLVPGLSSQEIDHLLKGGEPTPEIIHKAVEHARARIDAGKSPFAQDGEQVPYPGAEDEFVRGFEGVRGKINTAPVRNPNPVQLTPSTSVRG